MAALATFTFIVPPQSIELEISSHNLVTDVISLLSDLCNLDPAVAITLVIDNEPADPSAVFTSVASPDSPIIVEIAEPAAPAAPPLDDVHDRSAIRLPAEPPPDVDVDSLIELQKAILPDDSPLKSNDALIRRALQISFYDPDRAAAFLRNGIVPERPMAFICEEPDWDNASGTGMTSAWEENQTPERRAIRRLYNATGIDIPMLVQYYDACGRDEAKTLALLTGEAEPPDGY
jgi:hypothetical protein